MKNNTQDYEEKKCIICNKPYNYHYDLFGRTCLKNLYTQLNIPNHKFIFNREKHLCNVICHRNFKFFLNKNKKYALVQNYIALDYLKKMKLKSTENLSTKLNENIKSISIFKKYAKSMSPMYSLNDFYKVYNDYIDFKKLLDETTKNNQKIDETVLKGFSIIFDINKIQMPLFYLAFYELQYMFWETVVIGGLIKDMKLSSYLMQISLTNSGEYEKEGQVLIINDENISNLLINNEEFKSIINEFLIHDNVEVIKKEVKFTKDDLLLAIHRATISVNGSKNTNNTWNLNIELEDTYDFTEIIKDYIGSASSIKMSLFSSTLNNFAAISSSYNVIKPFNFIIKVNVKDYQVN